MWSFDAYCAQHMTADAWWFFFGLFLNRFSHYFLCCDLHGYIKNILLACVGHDRTGLD